ncbi:hypothetical protein C8F01DRAFT_1229220 [Mycena amicta]|nr:hypothetical protein C8F01DRAFT_1229220 [Mycena amicta]
MSDQSLAATLPYTSMAQSDFGTPRKEKRERYWSVSVPDHVTTRLAWPIAIIVGQLALMVLAFGFLGAVRHKGQIALGLRSAAFLQRNPQVKSYLFTLLANALSLFSSYLFTQAVRHAILVSLTRPLALSTLEHGLSISKKSIIFNKHYKWMVGSAAVFLVSLGQTPGWSSLFTPNAIVYSVPIQGTEFDMTSPSFQDEFVRLWNQTLQPFLDSAILSIIDSSGAASATAEAGYPALVDFGGWSHTTSTRGVFPIQFHQSTTGLSPATNGTQLITYNTSPFPSSTPVSRVSWRLTQQGIKAFVSCKEAILNETSTPPLFRFSEVLGTVGGTPFTFWNTTTTCGTESNSATSITTTNNTLFMVGCESVDDSGQQTFFALIDGQGTYESTYVCTIQPQIQNMVVDYSDVYVTSNFDNTSDPVPAGPVGFAGFYTVQSGVTYGQSGVRNTVGDAMVALFANQVNPDIRPLLEAYISGIVEFTGTALKTVLSLNSGPFSGNPPANMTHSINGTAFVNTVGWEFKTAASIAVLIPVILFAVLTIAIAVVSQLYNRGIPLRNVHFDPNDPLLLMAAASAGGLSSTFHGIDDDDVDKNLRKRVILGQVDGREGFVEA